MRVALRPGMSSSFTAPRAIIPRLKLDLGLEHLAAGALGLVPGPRERVRTELEAHWSPHGQAFACLSVRSGWDALLAALALPRGSEVLMSAVNIGHMAQVAEAHGLQVVPVDVDYDTLEPCMADMQRALSPRTRIVLIAHLFGAQVDLGRFAGFADRHGLWLVEDAAQAFLGVAGHGHPGALATLTSFGPIKTATALGGALLTVRDARVLATMREREARQPVQSPLSFAERLLRYGALRALSQPHLFGCAIYCAQCLGRDHDELLNRSTRSFPADQLLAQIRQQPCLAQLRLLHRRVMKSEHAAVQRRARVGAQLAAQLDPCAATAPGARAPHHSYWVFPVNARDPTRLAAHLLSAGFDATPGASAMMVLPATHGRERTCPGARRILDNVVYLPVQPDLSPGQVRRLAEAVNAHAL